MKIVWYTIMLSLGLASLLYASETKNASTPANPSSPQNMNSIMVIHPYKHQGMWVFDDEDKGLDKEPFVFGADVIIEHAVQDIPKANEGFNLIFAAIPFPGHQLSFERQEAEAGGYFYYSRDLDMKGWLCPALFKYFPEAPPKIYAQFKAKE